MDIFDRIYWKIKIRRSFKGNFQGDLYVDKKIFFSRDDVKEKIKKIKSWKNKNSQ